MYASRYIIHARVYGLHTLTCADAQDFFLLAPSRAKETVPQEVMKDDGHL